MDHPILTALLEALNTHIDARIQLALEGADFEGKVAAVATKVVADAEATTPEVDLDKLRDLVVPIVEEQVEPAVEKAMSYHTDEYDHEDYDRISEYMSNYDLDDFVLADDVESKIEDAVSELDLTERIRHELKYNMSLSISVD